MHHLLDYLIAEILQHYLNKFLISCWLSPAFLAGSRQYSCAGPGSASQPPAAAAQLSSALPRGCRHRALRAVISTAAKDTASATRTARKARAPRTTAAGATATTAATSAAGTTSAARAAPQRCPKY